MLFIAGTLLLCSVKISDPGTYGSFVKDVPTKILYVTKDGAEALVEYDFAKAPGIDVINKAPVRALVSTADLESKTYGKCRAPDGAQ